MKIDESAEMDYIDEFNHNSEVPIERLYISVVNNKKPVFLIFVSFFIFSTTYAIFKKPTWEGNFQILLSDKQERSSKADLLSDAKNPGLVKLVGINTGQNKLKTQVEILKSSSVLLPIYNHIKDYKTNKGINTTKLSYKKWLAKSLNVKLIKNTSVLDLSYFDKDKELILDVLKKISNQYQDFSGRDRRRILEKGINYLDRQVKNYTNIANSSRREAQQYAIDNNLTALQGFSESDNEVINFIDVETIRVKAANKIKNIDQQIKQIESFAGSPNTILYFSEFIPGLSKQRLAGRLIEVEDQLDRLRMYYTSNSKEIKDLLKKKKHLTERLRIKAINVLSAERSIQKAQLEAAIRPKGVIITFRELLRNTERNEQTLLKLENSYLELKLEKAKDKDPWELITEPTIHEDAYLPKKGKIITLGLIIGTIISIMYAYLREKSKNTILTKDELETLIRCRFLQEINSNEINNYKEYFELLSKNIDKANEISDIVIIPIGEINENIKYKFLNMIKDVYKGRNVLITSDLPNTNKFSNLFIITRLKDIKVDEIKLLTDKLSIINHNIIGWILIK